MQGNIYSSNKRGKVGKGRKFDHIQHIPIGKDQRGNTIYKHIFHRSENIKNPERFNWGSIPRQEQIKSN